MSSGALVGIDIGTSSAKGLAIDPETGAVLASAERPYPVSVPHTGWSEQQPEQWLAATHEVLAALRHSAPAFLGIGFSGQMHGLVCLDEADAVIRSAILWNDSARRPNARRSSPGTGAIASSGSPAIAHCPASRRRSCSGCARRSRRRTPASSGSACPRTTSAIC